MPCNEGHLSWVLVLEGLVVLHSIFLKCSLTTSALCLVSQSTDLPPKKDFLFIIGDWNAKVGSQETPGVTGKFRLGVRNEAG